MKFSHLTDHEINTAIAQVLDYEGEPPNYTQDLNAINDAIDYLGYFSVEWASFPQVLRDIVVEHHGLEDESEEYILMSLICANAYTRSVALLKVLHSIGEIKSL